MSELHLYCHKSLEEGCFGPTEGMTLGCENCVKIKTNNVYPPIPIRNHDWVAWYDSLGEDGSPYGYGRTEAESIFDLTTNFPPEDYLT